MSILTRELARKLHKPKALTVYVDVVNVDMSLQHDRSPFIIHNTVYEIHANKLDSDGFRHVECQHIVA